jgi:choline monooxygenase
VHFEAQEPTTPNLGRVERDKQREKEQEGSEDRQDQVAAAQVVEILHCSGAHSMSEYEVEPNVNSAAMLPGAFHADPAVFAAARERVFARAWHLAAPTDIPAEPESARPFTLLPGFLDEPLLFTRDAEGALRLLSNACTHRGALVAPEPCSARELRCPYHGRRFGLDGGFHAAPGFEAAQGFPRASEHLARVALAARGALHFFSLAPVQPFAEWADPLDRRLGFLPLADLRAGDAASARCFLVRANWALYVENYLEGFHVPFVHPALARALDLERYRIELLPHGVLQTAEARTGQPAFAPPAGHPDHGLRIAAYYLWLFPNLMLNFYPWGLSANVVEPSGPAETAVRYLRFLWDQSLLEHGAGAGLDRVEAEDEAIVASVQRGIRARLYPGGRFSPAHEAGVHFFQRTLAAAVSSTAPAAPRCSAEVPSA